MKKNKKHNLLEAVQFALAKRWQEAHEIVQEDSSEEAAWIHAVLHRIEGDESNAAYWYRRARRKVSSLLPEQELEEIRLSLENNF